MAYHDREAMIADLRKLPQSAWVDGVYFDVPKDRRRKQAMGTKRLQVNLPLDLQKRFATQINRYVEALGKDVAWDMMCQTLEAQDPENPFNAPAPDPSVASVPRADIPSEI